jgi:hypothetical protein
MLYECVLERQRVTPRIRYHNARSPSLTIHKLTIHKPDAF